MPFATLATRFGKEGCCHITCMKVQLLKFATEPEIHHLRTSSALLGHRLR